MTRIQGRVGGRSRAWRAHCGRAALLLAAATWAACAGSDVLTHATPHATGAAGAAPGTPHTPVAIVGEPTGDCELPLVFQDPALAQAVNREAQRQGVPFSPGALTRLGVDGARSLRGIECLVALRTAAFSHGALEDLSPIAGLGELEALHLEQDGIRDVGPLSALSRLRSLRLDNNSIEDVAPLASLTALEQLHFCDNRVADIAPLRTLTHLVVLRACNNRIESVEALASLTALRALAIDGNAITDITPLAALVELGNLSMSDNAIRDVAPLAAMTRLERLYLQGNRITDVRPLVGLPMLKGLMLIDYDDPPNPGINPIDCAAHADTFASMAQSGTDVVSHCTHGGVRR